MINLKKLFTECFILLILQMVVTFVVLFIVFDHTSIDAMKESFLTTIAVAIGGLIYILKFLAK